MCWDICKNIHNYTYKFTTLFVSIQTFLDYSRITPFKIIFVFLGIIFSIILLSYNYISEKNSVVLIRNFSFLELMNMHFSERNDS